MQENSDATRKRSLLLLVAIALVTLFVWNLPFVGWLLYPLTTFVTTLHEVGHALACVITGGGVSGMTVVSDGHGHGGLTMCRGGIPFIYTQTGYLGTAFFGCGLLYLARSKQAAKNVLVGLGALFAVAACAFMLPTLWHEHAAQGFWSILLAVAIASGLIYGGRKLSPAAAQLLVTFLAVVTALNALTDVLYLTMLSAGIFPSKSFSDATIMADMTGVPAVVWSLFWGGASAAMLYFTVRWTYLRKASGAKSEEV